MSVDRQIGIWGIVLGVFGTIFAIWTYIETKQIAQITYYVSHETVYRPSLSLDTHLFVPPNGDKISKRVVQTVVTVWNGGNIALKGEDTRAKLRMSGDSSISMLAHKLALTKILQGSTGFSIEQNERYIEVDWRVFDPGEAFQIVILSSGNSESMDVTGRFLPGQEIVRYPVRSWLKSATLILLLFGGAALMIWFFVGISPAISSAMPSPVVGTAVTFIAFAVFMVIIGVGFFKILNSSRSYVGDISPIDPYMIYIDVNGKLDYRYAPI